ncbi:MAG: hypothetical protein M1836_005425 [Candelina mexicana]|nr:MAG: hypothetical protein M1836_005425 [Candelina mexicana]
MATTVPPSVPAQASQKAAQRSALIREPKTAAMGPLLEIVQAVNNDAWIASMRTAKSAAPATITPAPTAQSFVDYWCDHPQFPGDGNMEAHPEIISGWFQGLNDTLKTQCFSLEEENYSSWARDTNPKRQSLWRPIATPPCCNVYCDIKASAVELFYWPKSSALQNVTTLVDSTGFTFTYPSVYVVYQQLSASNDCGVLGRTFASLTKAYASDAIMTLKPNGAYGLSNSLDYNDLWTNCTSRAPTTNLPNWEQVHCHPSIAYPKGLESMDPAWSTCHPGNFASVFDPPRALTPGAAMGGAKVTPNPSTSVAATPAPVITQPAPVQTPSSVPPANNGPVSDPPTPSKQVSTSEDPPIDHSLPDQGLPTGPQKTSSTFADLPAQNNQPAANNQPANNQPANNQPANNQPAPGDPGQSSQAQSSGSNDPGSATKANTAPGAMKDQAHDGSSGSKDPIVAAWGQANAAAPSTATTFLGYAIQAASSSGIALVNGQPISQGGDVVSISGAPMALQSNDDLLIGSSTLPSFLPVPNPIIGQSNPPPVINAGGQPATVLQNGVVIAGTTLSPNAPAITVAGKPVSLGAQGLVVGSSTVSLPTLAQAPVFSAGGQPLIVLPSGIAIAGTTLVPQAPPITIGDTTISLGTNGLVVETSTIPLGPLATIAGTQYSVGPGGLVVGSTQVALPGSPYPSAVTIAGQTYVISQGAEGVVLAGTTVGLGQSAITIAGVQVSVGSDGLVVGTSTIPLPSSVSLPSAVTIAGQAYAVTKVADGIVIAHTTILSGQSPVTISGTPVALASSRLIIGSSTISLQANVTSPSTPGGLGGQIISGLGGPAPSTADGPQSTGLPRNTTTGKSSNGTELFRGEGCKVGVQWQLSHHTTGSHHSSNRQPTPSPTSQALSHHTTASHHCSHHSSHHSSHNQTSTPTPPSQQLSLHTHNPSQPTIQFTSPSGTTYTLHLPSSPRTLLTQIHTLAHSQRSSLPTHTTAQSLLLHAYRDAYVTQIATSGRALIVAIKGRNKELLAEEALQTDREEGRGSEVLGYADNGSGGWAVVVRVWDSKFNERLRGRGAVDLERRIREGRLGGGDSGRVDEGGSGSRAVTSATWRSERDRGILRSRSVQNTRGHERMSGRGERDAGVDERRREERRPMQMSAATTIFSRHWNRSEGRWGFSGVRR